MHSCIYEGTVRHHRREPVAHQFTYPLFMVYLDLEELPSLVGRRGLISSRKAAACSFLRGDHLFEPAASLAGEVRDIVHRETARMPRGPIRLLTQLRCCGVYMSPLNLFYLFDPEGQQVEFIVAEVHNTPWNERHCYVLWEGNRGGGGGPDRLVFAHPKAFHVSPFMGMDMEYRWRLSAPGSALHLQLSNHRGDCRLFDAGMTLERRPLNRPQLRRMTVRYPLMSAQIVAAIYFHAFRLWWKKCPFYTHPGGRRRVDPAPDPSCHAPPASVRARSLPDGSRP